MEPWLLSDAEGVVEGRLVPVVEVLEGGEGEGAWV